jgi:putative serine protease PepD
MLFSSRPRRLALTLGACAGCAAALATAGVLAVNDQIRADRTPPAASLVQRYDAGIAAVVRKAFGSVVSLEVATAEGGEAAGTGVVVAGDGLILTNAHVVGDAATVAATLAVPSDAVPKGATVVAAPPHGSDAAATVVRLRGRVVAAAPERDLAVVSVPVRGLVPIALDRDGGLELGQRVIAIGNALGLTGAPSVTSGVVSGYRDLATDGMTYRHLIQTDAAINPGNSGGPLIDVSGRMVGINTITATAEDIGFAIETSQALELIDRVGADLTR